MLTVWHLYWDREGRVATAKQAYDEWPRISLKTYESAILEPEFLRALELRGIVLETSDSLSDLQHMAIMKLTDPGDRRTDRAKLRDLGISWPRYQGWLQSPVFVGERRRKAEATFASVADTALMKLQGNVDAGDQRAIEFALEVTGRYNRQTAALADARLVAQIVADAVIKHVPDREQREAILAEIRAGYSGISAERKAISS